VTSASYDECSQWDYYKWQQDHQEVGCQRIDFSSSDHGFKKYSIPLSQIKNGYCYIVMVHFADGSLEFSEVMEK